MRLEIKTADELRDPDLEARWAERREGPQAEVLRYILGAFAERGGPIPIGDIEAALAGRTAAQVRQELATLDEKDLILLEEGEVRLAYPFSAMPTPFVVRLQDGRERFACCAIDALGIPAMLNARVVVRRGPLAGLEAVFECQLSASGRVQLLMQLLGQQRKVQLDALDVELA